MEEVEPCQHGGLNYAELKSLRVSPDGVLDFSSSCNPFGPPRGVRETLSSTPIERYPDSEATELKLCLSERLGVGPEHILVGGGAVELIRLVALTYLERGERALILEPTFGEYQVACRIMGAKVSETRTEEGRGFEPDVGKILDLIRGIKPKGVFICNPNNPTGQYLSMEEVKEVLEVLEGGLLILDEAYISFVDDAWSSLDLIQSGNLVIIRSLTKDFALPGLRLGYAIAVPEIIEVLRRIKTPWSVSAAAQHAGLVALKDEGFLEESRKRISGAKGFLLKGLLRLGLSPPPSKTNFFLVKVGNAREVRLALLLRGILVRDCTSFGLPEYIRMAVRPRQECERLITALTEIIKHPPR